MRFYGAEPTCVKEKFFLDLDKDQVVFYSGTLIPSILYKATENIEELKISSLCILCVSVSQTFMKNTMKEKLHRGEIVFGATIGIPSLDIIEFMAKLNFDWLWFDTEHGPLNAEMLQPMLQVARSGHCTPIVRVAWNDQVLFKKVLDVGAHGLIIPWVSNRAQAEAAVRAAKYPPQGLRGFGPRWVFTAGGNPIEYAKTANDEVLLIAQIETKEAVDKLEEVLTTPGIDAFLIGPNDLAASLGHFGDIYHPEVEKTIENIIERAGKVGVPGGFAEAPIGVCRKRIEQGFKIITLGGDLRFLQYGAQDVLEKMGRSLRP